MRLLHTARRRFRRPAFTLVELIVVVTIIAILVSLSAAAVVRFITAQEISNTRTTVNKVYDRLNTSYKAYRQMFYKEPIPAVYHDWIQNKMAMGNPNDSNGLYDPNFEARVRVIWVKMRYKQTFPMSFAEALNPAPLPPLPTYQTYLGNLNITLAMVSNATYQQQTYQSRSNNKPTALESSACLLMALTQAQGGGGVNAEDMAGGQSVASFSLVNERQRPIGKTISAFVDAWGNPLTFSRWPTDSALLNPNGPQKNYNDPGDPQGTLAKFTAPGYLPPSSNPYSALFVQSLHKLPTNSDFSGSPYSYYLIPMLVSNGPDKKLGLDPTTLADDTSHDADDNIYSTTAP